MGCRRVEETEVAVRVKAMHESNPMTGLQASGGDGGADRRPGGQPPVPGAVPHQQPLAGAPESRSGRLRRHAVLGARLQLALFHVLERAQRCVSFHGQFFCVLETCFTFFCVKVLV